MSLLFISRISVAVFPDSSSVFIFISTFQMRKNSNNADLRTVCCGKVGIVAFCFCTVTEHLKQQQVPSMVSQENTAHGLSTTENGKPISRSFHEVFIECIWKSVT